MYYEDHVPPHFHARYGEYEAQVLISCGEVLNGALPRRALRLVKEWVGLSPRNLRRIGNVPKRKSPWLELIHCHDA